MKPVGIVAVWLPRWWKASRAIAFLWRKKTILFLSVR
jgi:hypothetical protein